MEDPFSKEENKKDRAGTVAQRRKKGVSVKADVLGVLSRTHMMEEESQCPGLFSDLYMYIMACTRTQ